MKARSTARREAMLIAAVTTFQEHGFDRTSMADIAAHTPCSKVTLYAYFDSKENLFYEAVVQALDVQFQVLYGVLDDSTSPIEEVLTRFGEQFISLVCADDFRALRRLVMTANGVGAANLQCKCYETGPKVALSVCASYFKKANVHGSLRVPDPYLAGLQLRALLEAEWLDTLFYNQQPKPNKKKIRDSAKRAIEAFLAIYNGST